MKVIVLASVLLTVVASQTWAAPGDPRLVQGVLEWPSVLSGEPLAVIRADDGQVYCADLATAARRTSGTLVAGDRLTIAGVEGARAQEIVASAFGGGDAAASGVGPIAAAASGKAVREATTPAGAPAPELWRLHGRLMSIGPRTVTLQADDGTSHTIDISGLTAPTRTALRRGDEVSLYGEPRKTGRLIANGYLQLEPPPPAASPLTAPAPS